MAYKFFVVKNEKGQDVQMSIDEMTVLNLDNVKKWVLKRNWDYVAVVAGIPGSGKSTLARTLAKYCCDWFDSNHIAFTAEDFINLTNNCKEYSAIVLDESFETMNNRQTMSPEFVRIINHLQLVRQKHLYIFLCLPNFFDLAKPIALFRTSHLFVAYPNEDGSRGYFAAFDRENKKYLYIKGAKYVDYQCQEPNYNGRFVINQDIIDMDKYNHNKREHLMSQSKTEYMQSKITSRKIIDPHTIILNIKKKLPHFTQNEISDIVGLSQRQISSILKQKLPQIPE